MNKFPSYQDGFKNPLRAFTLIELLVVIAIIALLMAIIMPALSIARKQGQMTHCLHNHKTIATAWYMYHTEYDGKMVGSDAWNMKQAGLDDAWCDCPRREDGSGILYEGCTLEDELCSIKNGRLWPYIKSYKAYNCTGDNRKSLATFYGYRTYSLAGGLNGQWVTDFFTEITNVSELRNPSTKYVSVENAVYPTAAGAGQFWSYGAWVLNYTQAYLYDPMASFHNKVTTLGFGDGHVEKYKYRNAETWEWVEAGLPKNLYMTAGSTNTLENVDVRYFLNGFACKENPN